MKRKFLLIFLSLLTACTLVLGLTACGDCKHAGGTATCSSQAICVKCNEAYGGYAKANHSNLIWQTTQGKHTRLCTGCGKVTVPTENHQLIEGACGVCGYACEHTGGNATCVQQAECEKCGTLYGGYDDEKHSGLAWVRSADAHTKKCGGCGTVVVATEEHTWENGVCSVCEYTCLHTGGTATCEEKAVCTACGEEYGEKNATAHTDLAWEKTAAGHAQKCNGCGVVVAAADGHVWTNGTCGICGFTCAHSMSEATCQSKATCAACGVQSGEKDEDNHVLGAVWQKTATAHKQYYPCCGAVVVAEGEHDWENGACSVCEYTCLHTGGNATCEEKAVCTACGEEYGEKNATAHTDPAWEKTAMGHAQVCGGCGAVIVATEGHVWDGGACAVCEYVCLHTSGNATCQGGSVCGLCGVQSGEKDEDNHVLGAVWQKTATAHKQYYPCCGVEIVAEDEHDWENGACAVCEYICLHTGGTATCQGGATCETCGETYGAPNAANHAQAATWETTPTTHSGQYLCCGTIAVVEADHRWENGACAVCEYICLHTGGNATCRGGATCETCGETYGAPNAENHAADAIWEKTALSHRRYYPCCGTVVLETATHDWEGVSCAICGYVCLHTGGTANCQSGATCATCGEEYGELDQSNHAQGVTWNKTATKHSGTYLCCNTPVVQEEEHTWDDGVCAVCDYACNHTGGTATCRQRAVCSVCGDKYGDLSTENHTAGVTWQKTETTHKQTYACCGALASAEASHAWNSGVCDSCDYVCLHAGGTATCTQKATCEYCGEEYGDVDSGCHAESVTWNKTATRHSGQYLCCGTVAVVEEDHQWRNGICAVCDYDCLHTGGTATCVDKATCVVCGEKYGAIAAHTGGTATCAQKAECSVCGNVYGDKDADNHARQTVIEQTAVKHKQYYPCCNEIVLEQNHTWKNGVCSVCDYVCEGTLVLNKTGITLERNATASIGAEFAPSETGVSIGTDVPAWSSSDKSVATVSASGVVTAVGKGKATITATYGNAQATCEISVYDLSDRQAVTAKDARINISKNQNKLTIDLEKAFAYLYEDGDVLVSITDGSGANVPFTLNGDLATVNWSGSVGITTWKFYTRLKIISAEVCHATHILAKMEDFGPLSTDWDAATKGNSSASPYYSNSTKNWYVVLDANLNAGGGEDTSFAATYSFGKVYAADAYVNASGEPTNGNRYAVFNGTFDGRGYSITGLNTQAGFIANLGTTGVIKNLALLDARNGRNYSCGILGIYGLGTVENVFVEGYLKEWGTYSSATYIRVDSSSPLKVKNSLFIVRLYYSRWPNVNNTPCFFGSVLEENASSITNSYGISPHMTAVDAAGTSASGIVFQDINAWLNSGAYAKFTGLWEINQNNIFFGGQQVYSWGV